MGEIKYSTTESEQTWCIDTISRIKAYLPKHYTGVAQARLKKLGVDVSSRYITDCKNLRRHDARVVAVLEQMARDSGKSIKLPTRDEIMKKYF